MKIYTKGGDKGRTALFGGGRVSKAQLRVAAYGDVDELVAQLGILRDLMGKDPVFEDLRSDLFRIQNELFNLASELATLDPSYLKKLVSDDDILTLEKSIDSQSSLLPPLTNFVLAGGHLLNSQAHLARCICRRTERGIVALHDSEPLRSTVLSYINRLSDWLFIVARTVLHRLSVEEVVWRL